MNFECLTVTSKKKAAISLAHIELAEKIWCQVPHVNVLKSFFETSVRDREWKKVIPKLIKYRKQQAFK